MVASATQAGILQKVIGPSDRELPAEVARFFLDLSFTDADRDRMATLSEKANEGQLSPAEHEELAFYVIFSDFLLIMQSRARASLKPNSPVA